MTAQEIIMLVDKRFQFNVKYIYYILYEIKHFKTSWSPQPEYKEIKLQED